MPGRFFWSRDGRTGFEERPTLFGPDMCHSAVRVVEGAAGAELEVFWTRVGDAPECILRSRVSIAGPWERWREIDEPCVPSIRGAVNEPVNQLRDPCLFCDPGDGTWWLFSAVAGESGIAVARL
jgi:hypothetical protein